MKKARKSTPGPIARPRRALLVMIIGRDRHARAALVRAIGELIERTIITTADNLTEGVMCREADEPTKDELFPRVIVYCSAVDQSPSEVNGACRAIENYGPKAKRRAPRIILYAARVTHQPTTAEVTIVMQPNVETVCALVKRHAPRGAKPAPAKNQRRNERRRVI